MLLLPYAAALAYTNQPRGFLEWLTSSWEEHGDGFWEELWLMIFLGYMMKDIVSMSMTLPMLPFWVHHVASIVIAMTFLFLSPPCIFIVGGTLCELGSGTQSMFYLAEPKSTRSLILWVHAIGMSASNIGSVILLGVFVFGQDFTPLPAKAFFAVVSLLMFMGRQLFCISNVQGAMKAASLERGAVEKAKGKAI